MNDINISHAFRNYYYAIAIIKLIEKYILENICLDIKYFVSLINWVWLKKYLFNVSVRKITSSIIIRELRSVKH